MKLKVLELFAGIGACSKALERLEIEHEIVDAVEIDKYAIKSFNVIHGTNFETQDITTWDKNIEVDLIMHGSPCQDFSLAGKQAGGDFGSGTRSSLMYETIRIVGKLRPKYVIWENVKNVLSKKHKHNFDRYIYTMETLGYKNYYQVLDAKDYGIPQHRERVFTISILGNNSFEFPKEHIEECEVINPLKDISGKSWQFEQNVYSENSILRSLKAGGGSGNIPKVIEHFEFPPKQELKLRLKDILEDEVDEKYYLNNVQIEKIKNSNFMQEKKRIQNGEISDTLLARDWKDPKCVRIGGIFDTDKEKHQAGSIYDKEGISPTLDAMQGGWRQPSIVEENKIEINTYSPYVNKKYDEFINEKGYIPELFNPYNKSEIKNIAPTLTAQGDSITKSGTVLKSENNYRIRKLTPKECWRLMGFDDEDFEKAEKVNSNTQLYKQARKQHRCKCIRKNIYKFVFKIKKERIENER
jgi:DNA (cytosine-5)-methyltransferase 1